MKKLEITPVNPEENRRIISNFILWMCGGHETLTTTRKTILKQLAVYIETDHVDGYEAKGAPPKPTEIHPNSKGMWGYPGEKEFSHSISFVHNGIQHNYVVAVDNPYDEWTQIGNFDVHVLSEEEGTTEICVYEVDENTNETLTDAVIAKFRVEEE